MAVRGRKAPGEKVCRPRLAAHEQLGRPPLGRAHPEHRPLDVLDDQERLGEGTDGGRATSAGRRRHRSDRRAQRRTGHDRRVPAGGRARSRHSAGGHPTSFGDVEIGVLSHRTRRRRAGGPRLSRLSQEASRPRQGHPSHGRREGRHGRDPRLLRDGGCEWHGPRARRANPLARRGRRRRRPSPLLVLTAPKRLTAPRRSRRGPRRARSSRRTSSHLRVPGYPSPRAR